MRITVKQICMYTLVLVIVMGLAGCDGNTSLVQGVQQFGSFYVSQDGSELIGFGVIPNVNGFAESGKLVVGSLLNTGEGFKVTISSASDIEGVTNRLMDIINSKGMVLTPWTDLDNMTKVIILAKLEEAANFINRASAAALYRSTLTSLDSSPMFGMFMMPGVFWQEELPGDNCIKIDDKDYCSEGPQS